MNGNQSPDSQRHSCPICGAFVRTRPRYPTAVCPGCAERAVDEHGRPIRFHDRSMSGGFQAVCASAGDADTGEERGGIGEFLWKNPEREGAACTPETCLHATNHPPGFVAATKPGGTWEMVCVHAECGGVAQEALIDWEAKERQRQEQWRQSALAKLRRLSVERTLFAPQDEAINLSSRSLLEALELVLVPEWDRQMMLHVVAGWQAAAQARTAEELRAASPADERVQQVLRERWGRLADRHTKDSVSDVFPALREGLTRASDGLQRWVACLALMRTWREQVETAEQIDKHVCALSSL